MYNSVNNGGDRPSNKKKYFLLVITSIILISTIVLIVFFAIRQVNASDGTLKELKTISFDTSNATIQSSKSQSCQYYDTSATFVPALKQQEIESAKTFILQELSNKYDLNSLNSIQFLSYTSNNNKYFSPVWNFECSDNNNIKFSASVTNKRNAPIKEMYEKDDHEFIELDNYSAKYYQDCIAKTIRSRVNNISYVLNIKAKEDNYWKYYNNAEDYLLDNELTVEFYLPSKLSENDFWTARKELSKLFDGYEKHLDLDFIVDQTGQLDLANNYSTLIGADKDFISYNSTRCYLNVS